MFRSFLEEDGGLDWFRWLTGEVQDVTVSNLPSWVPGFGPRLAMPISSFSVEMDHRLPRSERDYLASGPDRSRSRINLRFSDNSNALVLEGCKFDHISQVGTVNPSMDNVLFHHGESYAVFDEWQEMAKSQRSGPYSTDLAIDTAFWKTLLVDRQIEELHFHNNAGWYPSVRLLGIESYVPPKNSQERKSLIDRIQLLRPAASLRRFCVSGGGPFGLVPALAQPGDIICVLLGGEVPYILRRCSDGDRTYYHIVEMVYYRLLYYLCL